MLNSNERKAEATLRESLRKHLRKNLLRCVLSAGALVAPLGRADAQQRQMPPPWPPQLVAKLEKLRDAALSSDYAWRQVAHLTENIGPRLSGSLQAEQAVKYVADELRRLGLEVKLEKVAGTLNKHFDPTKRDSQERSLCVRQPRPSSPGLRTIDYVEL
jgi:hypothetical protein